MGRGCVSARQRRVATSSGMRLAKGSSPTHASVVDPSVVNSRAGLSRITRNWNFTVARPSSTSVVSNQDAFVEAHRLAITDIRLDQGQVDTALGPLEVLDAAAMHVFDATRFEVLEVLGVVHDPHQVGVAETGSNDVGGLAGRVRGGSHRCRSF